MHNQTIYFRLRTVAPLHVGCGEVYEPTGFAVDEVDKVLISFDPTALLEQLDDEELKKFSSICRKGTAASLIEVYNFINRHKGLVEGERVSVSTDFVEHYHKTLQLKGGRINNELNQFKVERTAFNNLDGLPYIPGSAIKGAIRTAVLNARNGGRNTPRPRDAKNLETRLTGGTFESDPFRLVKVSDFIPLGTVKRRIVYAVNRKKKPSEREAQAPYQIFEVIEPEMEFFGTITVQDHQQTGMPNPLSFAEIDKALHSFYEKELRREYQEVKDAGCGTEQYPHKPEEATLLRVGRHSGAESVTIDGFRNIRIMQARGTPPKFLPHATTLWFASNSSRPVTNNALQPFGWVEISVLTDKEAKQCIAQCDESYKNRQHTHFEKIDAQREKVKILRAQALAEELLQKQLEEEQRLRLREKQEYPWRELLTDLSDITDWGTLKLKALDNEALKAYQNQPEVGKAVKAAAELVRKAKQKKWETENRDQLVMEWLAPSGTPWLVTYSPTPAQPILPADEQQRVERILSCKDWGDFKNSRLVISELTQPAAEALRKLFVVWGVKKAKNQEKKNAWKELDAHLRKMKQAG